ncbi:hypothetical protein PMAYCL1PPCAC_25193, partial [Pristionchus mayeri]
HLYPSIDMATLRETLWEIAEGIPSLVIGYLLVLFIDVNIVYLLEVVSFVNILARLAFLIFWTLVEKRVLGEGFPVDVISVVVISRFPLVDAIDICSRLLFMCTGICFVFNESYLPSIFVITLVRAALHMFRGFQKKLQLREFPWCAGQALVSVLLGHLFTSFFGSLLPHYTEVEKFVLGDLSSFPSLLVLNLGRLFILAGLICLEIVMNWKERHDLHIKLRNNVHLTATAARNLHSRAHALLAAGLPIPAVRIQCEPETLRRLASIRNWLSSILKVGENKDVYEQFIPEVEEVIAILERTLVLCRPPVAA